MHSWTAGLLVVSMSACGAGVTADAEVARTTEPMWDLDRAELVSWRADDPAFDPERKVEASGLVAANGLLWATVEKYGRLLRIDPEDGSAIVVHVAAPPRSEVEGIAWCGDELILCDEIHAALYRIGPSGEVRALSLEGTGIVGGKSGLEGVATLEDGRLALLTERTYHADDTCTADVYLVAMDDEGVRPLAPEPVRLPLEDCAWRLAGLEMWDGRLLGLKTQFPGERYEVVEIDLERGVTHRLLDMTTLLRSVRADGWGNNVEGIAVTPDGTLWLIGDNAATDGAQGEVPGRADDRSLLVRIPRSERTQEAG